MSEPRNNPVHGVAANHDGSVCAFVRGDGQLTCFDMHRREQIGAFQVIFDIGGDRCAIDAEGKVCITATCQRYGVAAYALPGGELLWRRPDLKKVQRIVWDNLRGHCILVRDRASAQVIDPDTGQISRSTALPLNAVIGCFTGDGSRFITADRTVVLTETDEDRNPSG